MAAEQTLSPQVRRKLANLRSLLRAHLVTRGLGWVVVALVVAVFFSFAVDYLLRMTGAQRAVISAVAAAGIAFVVWRFLLRPLRVPMASADLALVLEGHYPELDDRLISALQFTAAETRPVGASESMMGRVVAQANDLAGGLDASGPVAARQTWRRMGFPGAAMVVLAGFSICFPELMWLWFRRNVLFADDAWPQQTYLRVAARPGLKVIQGGTLELEVTASGRKLPEDVTFHMRFPSLPGEVKEAVRAGAPGVYVKRMVNVSEGFRFYVTGNDAETPSFTVVVVRPPELVELSGVKYFPDYMNRPASDFRPEHGLIAVPAGSRLFFSGRADKDLSSARLRLDDQTSVELQVKTVTAGDDPASKGRPRALEGALHLPERVGKPAMLLRFELTDTEGVTNPRGAAYSLRIEPDHPPGVSLARRGVRGEITAKANVKLAIQARDNCAVAGLGVEMEVVRGREGATRPAPREFQVTGFPTGQQNVETQHAIDLQQLRELKLEVADRIRLWALARDNLPETFGGPNVARSVVQTLKIVPEEEILEELLRRQKEITQEFTRTVVLQAEVLARVRAVGDRLPTAGADEETRRRLRSSAAEQRRVAAQCAAAGQQLQAVLEEMQCNRVGSPADESMLVKDILPPLAALSEKDMPETAGGMDRASKLQEPGSVRAAVEEAVLVLEGFYRQLEALLEMMKKFEDRRELAYRLKIIIGLSKDIETAIKQLMQQQVKGVLQDGPKKDEENRGDEHDDSDGPRP